MNSPIDPKSLPRDWKLVLGADIISRSIARMSYEILERNRELDTLCIVGIRTGGEHLARRLQKRIEKIEGLVVPFGVLDITLYRDDVSTMQQQAVIRGTDLPFDVSGATVILVDDVLYTGRTVRAALDAIIDFGRPRSVQLAILVDRGHRELPIRPDYIGKNLPTSKKQSVHVRLEEQGYEDGVYTSDRKGGREPGKGE